MCRRPHLSVGLLRLLPADHDRVLGDDVGLHVAGRAGRGLLPGAGLHTCRGGTLADAVEGRHSDLVLCVGVQPPDAVAGGGDAVHRLVLAVRPFGSVLDDVVGDGVRVARVPGDGHAGGSGLGDYGRTGRLRQSWGSDRGRRRIIAIHPSVSLLTLELTVSQFGMWEEARVPREKRGLLCNIRFTNKAQKVNREYVEITYI